MKTTPFFAARFELSGPYFEASYPYGKPMHPRQVWYATSLRRVSGGPNGLFPTLPVSQWKIVRYDDAPRKYSVTQAREVNPIHFTARSLAGALKGIEQACSVDADLA